MTEPAPIPEQVLAVVRYVRDNPGCTTHETLDVVPPGARPLDHVREAYRLGLVEAITPDRASPGVFRPATLRVTEAGRGALVGLPPLPEKWSAPLTEQHPTTAAGLHLAHDQGYPNVPEDAPTVLTPMGDLRKGDVVRRPSTQWFLWRRLAADPTQVPGGHALLFEGERITFAFPADVVWQRVEQDVSPEQLTTEVGGKATSEDVDAQAEDSSMPDDERPNDGQPDLGDLVRLTAVPHPGEHEDEVWQRRRDGDSLVMRVVDGWVHAWLVEGRLGDLFWSARVGDVEVVAPGPGAARVERDRIRSLLLRASAGRAEYAKGAPDELRRTLETEANAFTNAAALVDDPGVMLGLMPSRIWTAEEDATVTGRQP